MTSDFYRYYGDSPARLFDRGVSLIDIAAMAVNLPTDSATLRAIDPPDPADMWDLGAQLLARIADELAIISYVQQRKAGARPSRPKPIPRPGVSEVEQLKGDSFDSPEAFEVWYAGRFPGRATSTASAPSTDGRPTIAHEQDHVGPDTNRQADPAGVVEPPMWEQPEFG